MQQGITPELMDRLLTDQPPDKLKEGLFEYFAEFAVKKYQNHEVFKSYRHAKCSWLKAHAGKQHQVLISTTPFGASVHGSNDR